MIAPLDRRARLRRRRHVDVVDGEQPQSEVKRLRSGPVLEGSRADFFLFRGKLRIARKRAAPLVARAFYRYGRPEEQRTIRTVRFTADGRRALLGNEDLREWDVERDQCLTRTIGPLVGVEDISVGGGRLAAVGDNRGTVCVWDLDRGQILHTWKAHTRRVFSVCLSSDGRRILTSCWDDGSIKLWEAGVEGCVRTFEGHEEAVSRVLFTPDARFAFSASLDGTLRLWDVETGRCLHVFEEHLGQRVRHLELSNDLKHLLSATDGGLRLWELDWELAVL
jgi:WD40 repeat protein